MSMLSGRGDQDTQQFWENLEESLGTPIRGYALGRYLSGRDPEGPLWGLLYVTDETLFFHHFAQTNWFSAIMDQGRSRSTGSGPGGRGRAGGHPGRNPDGSVTIEVGLHRLHVLEGSEPRGWRAWFSGADRDTYRLVDQSGARPPLEFTVEQSSSSLLRELRVILEEKRTPRGGTSL